MDKSHYYYNLLYEHYSKRHLAGKLSEEVLEDRLGAIEEMSCEQRRALCKRVIKDFTR